MTLNGHQSSGEPYISLDIEAGEPLIDAYVYINEAEVLSVGLGQDVTFSGTIDDDWTEPNGFYSLQIRDGAKTEFLCQPLMLRRIYPDKTLA